MGKEKKQNAVEKDKTRIGRLDNHTLGYYRRVSDTLRDSPQTNEDKEILIENVFDQLCKEALSVCQNQTASTIVEQLLQEAKPIHLLRLMNALAADWETACSDRFASHVTQTLLLRSMPHMAETDRPQGSDDDDDATPLRTFKSLFIELYSLLMSNVAVFMQHTYASHILRVVMEVLAGCTVSQAVIKSKISRHHNKQTSCSHKDVTPKKKPEEFDRLLLEITNKVTNLGRLKDHAENYLSNPVIQTCLLVLKSYRTDKAMEACQTVMENTDMWQSSADKIPELLTHEIGSWLAEQVLKVATEEVFSQILESNLQPHIASMAEHPIANFVLQTLITQTHTSQQFELVYSLLEKHVEDILAHNHVGVLVKLAEGCLKHHTKQDKLLKRIMKAFHCYKPVERQTKIAPLLTTLTAYETFYKIPNPNDSGDKDEDSSDDEEPVLPMVTRVNLHGSVLMQKLLQFGNPRLVVNSLLELKPAELKLMGCDPCGSHILDNFVQSKTIGEKSRTQFYGKLKGLYVDMACNKNGSRTLESLWEIATIQQRTPIAEELSKHADRLRGDPFGRFVYRSCSLHHFVHRRKDWKDMQTGQIKKRKLFQEITASEESPKKKVKTDESKLELPADEESDNDNQDVNRNKLKEPRKDSTANEESESNKSCKKPKKKKKHKNRKGD